MRLLHFLTVLAVLLFLPALGKTRWSPQGCAATPINQGLVSPVVFSAPLAQTSAPTSTPSPYLWKEIADTNGEQFALYKSGTQAGVWSAKRGVFLPIVNGEWGEPTTPPISPPKTTTIPLENWKLNGVDTSKISPEEAYSISGRHVSKHQALFTADKVPDDSKDGFLVILGPDADKRKKVKEEFEASAELADLRSKTRVWSSSADHPQVKDRDTGESLFKADGDPTVLYMDANGEVLHRQEGYNSGDIGALRKINPNYDPRKDLDLRRNLINRFLPKNWLLLAGGVLALYFLTKKGN